MEDFATTWMPEKFWMFGGANKNDPFSVYFGPSISKYSSPLARANTDPGKGVMYVTIHPYNGGSATNRGISATMMGLVRQILGHPLTDEDLKMDTDEVYKNHNKEFHELLPILLKERFVIPGYFEGGNTVHLLANMGIGKEQLISQIDIFKKKKNRSKWDELKWEELLDGTDD